MIAPEGKRPYGIVIVEKSFIVTDKLTVFVLYSVLFTGVFINWFTAK